MTLDKAKIGQTLLIISIKNPQIRAQAIRFGISEGSQALVEQTIPAGPVILRRNRQEIAIGRALAQEIGIQIIA
ncbi:MAG TPA: ferrous iron transport protein A [Candidatus Deferrimicrobium sp.]|jgi:Fe2+ transport system protein FeoA|nr:ferrous iron transport protein A [Candidatus Deferrimicrobium sp.]